MVTCHSCGHHGPPGIGWHVDEGSPPKAGLWCKACGRRIEPAWLGADLLDAVASTPVATRWPSWHERRLAVGLEPDEPEFPEPDPAAIVPEEDDGSDAPATISKAVDVVRSWLGPRMAKGVACPACGRFTKLYVRHLNSGMAKALIVIYRLSRESGDADGWVGVGKKHMAKGYALDLQHAEYSKLKHWGLIEEKARGSKAGLWRPTRLGVDFVEGRAKVPQCVLLKHNRKVGTAGEEIGIDEAIASKFDKVALMGALAESVSGIAAPA